LRWQQPSSHTPGQGAEELPSVAAHFDLS
jgi:hypothetical protein